MHEHLREVRAMWLIFRLSQDDLGGADDAGRVLGDEEESLATRQAGPGAAPERVRLGAGHRQHEADGGPAFHAIDQQVAQPLDLARAERGQTANHHRSTTARPYRTRSSSTLTS